jgi:hypothetical protein
MLIWMLNLDAERVEGLLASIQLHWVRIIV